MEQLFLRLKKSADLFKTNYWADKSHLVSFISRRRTTVRIPLLDLWDYVIFVELAAEELSQSKLFIKTSAETRANFINHFTLNFIPILAIIRLVNYLKNGPRHLM